MKYFIRWLVGLAVCCCFGYASQASAGSATFVDNDDSQGSMTVNCVFPSQTSVTTCAGQDTCPYPSSPPNITTVTVSWDYVAGVGNVLQTITLTSTNGFLYWDSLFINNDYTGNSSDLENWNYYVLNDYVSNGQNYINSGQTLPSQDGLYKVASSFDPSMYTTANEGRTGHANGIDADYLTLVDSGNFAKASAINTLTYDFSSLTTPIILGDNFAIGWTPYCANDVVLVAGSTGNAAIPEPASMVLFGMGLASLAGWRTRRAKK